MGSQGNKTTRRFKLFEFIVIRDKQSDRGRLPVESKVLSVKQRESDGNQEN